jgi:hypothetical protein
MNRKIEVNAEALELNIEKTADEIIESLLNRAQEAEAANRSLALFKKPRMPIGISEPFSNLVSMIGVEPLNRREVMAVTALLAYVAHNQNVKQEIVETMVEAEFGVNHVEKIQRLDFQRAVDFLIDLHIEEI